MHTGSGDVLQIDKEDRETVMIVSGFTNQQSLLEYLGSLGFETVSIRSKTGPKTDLFIPHSSPPGDSVARGHCHVAVKRTEMAIRLLEEFYRGEWAQFCSNDAAARLGDDLCESKHTLPLSGRNSV